MEGRTERLEQRQADNWNNIRMSIVLLLFFFLQKYIHSEYVPSAT